MKRKLNHPSIPFSPITVLPAVVMALAMLAPAPAHAQSGTWTNLSGGSWATAANWSDGVIANGTDATADFSQLTLKGVPVVTLDGPQYIENLAFGDKGNTYGWTLNTGSGGPLTLAVSSDLPTITVNGQTTTIGFVLDGYSGLAKAGAGTLTLKGTEVNTFTGGLVLSGGTLMGDFTSLAVPTDLINSGNTLKLSGGSLRIKGKSSGTTGQTLGDVTVGAGGGAILADVNGGTGTAITLGGGLTTSIAGGSLVVGSSGANDTGLIITSTSNTNSAFPGGALALNIYGPRIAYTSDNGTTVDWGTTMSSESPYAITNYSGYVNVSASGNYTAWGTAGSGNYSVAPGIFVTNTATGRPQTVKMNSGSTLNLAATKFNLQNGGLLCVGSSACSISGAPAVSATVGICANWGNGAPYELIVQQYNPAGLTVGAGFCDTVATTGPLTLTKAGPGTLTLTGTNQYTGATYINAGTLTLSGAGQLGLTASYAGKITNNGSLNYASSKVQTLSGVIAGLGSLTVTGPGTLTLSGANTYSGNTSLTGGKLALSSSGTLGGTSSIQIGSGATLDVSAQTTALSLGSSQTLIVTATGATVGGTNIVASGKNLTLSSGGVKFTAYGGGSTAPLVVAGTGSSLALNGAPVTVTTTAPLGTGTYVLITNNAAGATVTGPPGALTINGSGLSGANSAGLIVNNGALMMTVAPGALLTSLTVSGFPNPQTAGTAGSVTVTAKDQNGNTFTTYTGTIKFTSSDGSAVLPSNYKFVSGDNGTHTFPSGVTLKTAGTQSITATDTNTPGLNGTQSGITVIPANAVALAMSGFPNPAQQGLPANFTVMAKDPYGNTDTNYTGTVTISSSDPLATFTPIPYTFQTTDAGAAVFSGTLNTMGTQSITTSDGTFTVAQNNILVVAPPTTFWWTNPVSGNWSSVANWTNNLGSALAPYSAGQANYVINFNQPGTYTANNNLDSGFLLNQLNLDGPTLTLAGNDLGLINDNATLPQINQNSAAAVTVSNNLALGAATTVGGAGSGPMRLAGEVYETSSGAGSLTLTNSGTLTLSASNSYTGGTTISASTLVLSNAQALSTGPVVNNGILNLMDTGGGNGATFSGTAGVTPLTGSGTNNVALGTSTMTSYFYDDCSGFSGVWNIGVPSGGGAKLQMRGNDNQAAPPVYNVLSNATLYFYNISGSAMNYGSAYLYGGSSGGAQVNGQLRSQMGQLYWEGPVILAGPIANGANLGATPATASITVDGNISEINGSQSLVVSGNGTVILTGTNTYTGPTVINGTTQLIINNTYSLGHGRLTIPAGGPINLNYSGDVQISSLSLGGTYMPHGTYGSSISGATYQNDTYFTNISAGTVTVFAAPPTANFTGSPTNGICPLTVTFTDLSTLTGSPITNRSWSFGDLTMTNTTATNVVHTYTTAGTYTVTLVVSSLDGSGSLTRTGYITVAAPNPPHIDSVTISGTNVILSGSGGPTNGGYNYYVLTSTNAAQAMAIWTTNAAMGSFSPNTGTFIYTNAVIPGTPQEFFRLLMP